MAIEADIYALAMTCTALTAIIGTRFTPMIIPEGSAMPAARFLPAGGQSFPTFSTSGLQKLRVQFDFFADIENGTYDDAMNAREAWREFLNGYSGTLESGTLLQNADLIQYLSFAENDARQYRCMVEFYLYFVFLD
jgi:hypothetical protein